MDRVQRGVNQAETPSAVPLQSRLPDWWRPLRSFAPTSYLLPLLLIVIFADPAYISLMNPFYMDAAALVSLLWTLVFICTAVLLVASKAQHGFDPIRQLTVFHAVTELIIVFSAGRVLAGIQPGLNRVLRRARLQCL